LSSSPSRTPPPRRRAGSLTSKRLMKSLTSHDNSSGMGGWIVRIRLCVRNGYKKNNYWIRWYPSLRRTGNVRYLEISCWLFLSPSTVKGDAPVSNSYVSTPTPHQSTAWNQTKKERKRRRSFRIKSPRHQSIDRVEGVDQCIFHVSMFSSG